MSDIEKYSGLCIDGPKDGKRIDCELPRMRAVILPKMRDAFDPNAKASQTEIEVTRFEYQHVPFHFHTGDGRNVAVGFWVDREIQEPRIWVLERLSAAYEAGAGN